MVEEAWRTGGNFLSQANSTATVLFHSYVFRSANAHCERPESIDEANLSARFHKLRKLSVSGWPNTMQFVVNPTLIGVPPPVDTVRSWAISTCHSAHQLTASGK